MRHAALAGVVIATALAWVTAFPGAFQFDDFRVVVYNPDVHSPRAWLASMPGIRPLTKLSYALNWQFDTQARGFIAVGLACHIANACMVLVLARAWLADFGPQRVHRETAAVVATLVFALHPAQTEAATYVAGRSVVLSALFLLGSLCAWEAFRQASRHLALVASVLLFALAVCARETAVVLPALIVLREMASGATLRAALGRTRWHWLLALGAFAAVLALPGYRRLFGASLDFRGPLESLAMQPAALLHLVTHPLATLRLSIDPEVAQPVLLGLQWWTGVAAVGLVAVGGCVLLRRIPLVGFAILWFLIVLVPMFGPLARLDAANDRQLYLSIIGPALLAGAFAASIRSPLARGTLALLLALPLAIATLVRNLDYQSETRLWEATARVSPGKARVWNNLGYAYVQAGDRERARVAFERALALDPDYYKARENLRDLR